MTVDIELRSSGRMGPMTAQWGTRDSRLVNDVIEAWRATISALSPRDGVAIIIRRAE
jgi:hypothetical protein